MAAQTLLLMTTDYVGTEVSELSAVTRDRLERLQALLITYVEGEDRATGELNLWCSNQWFCIVGFPGGCSLHLREVYGSEAFGANQAASSSDEVVLVEDSGPRDERCACCHARAGSRM